MTETNQNQIEDVPEIAETEKIAETETVNKDFSWALSRLKEGDKVARKGWNGKDMFIFLVHGSTFEVNRAPLNEYYPEGTEIKYHSHVDMKTAQGEVVPWLCSQTDMLADDWEFYVGVE